MKEAYAVVERWGQAFNAGDADTVASLYAPGATIWGTLAEYLTTSPADIRTYVFEATLSGLRVKLGPHVLSPMSETYAIDAGHYEFTRTTDGQKFPARYSFFLMKQNGEWMIAHQHSSILPKRAGA